MMDICFAGDTHGDLSHLVEAPAGSAVIHVGDLCPLGRPLEHVLPRELHDRFFWIPGNHEYDSESDYASVFTAFGRERCFDLKVIDIAGYRIAGMGGIFSSNTWWPKSAIASAVTTRKARLQETPPHNRFQGGLKLKQRKFIFREDFDLLSTVRADILVTHEAPSTHRHGFAAIDELGRRMGAHTIVHGHHHRDYVAVTADGVRVIGVGLRGLADVQGNVVRPGERRGVRRESSE